MVYIDKIKSGKKSFYYLGKTIRIGQNKWKKIRIKLGVERPSKEIISKKLKELKLEQYKLYNEDYIDVAKLEIIDDFKEASKNHLKEIPRTLLEKEEEDFIIRFTYNSNAIEGNRLTLRDTYFIIKERQIPSGAPPKDYNEAINGKEAFEVKENPLEQDGRKLKALAKNAGVGQSRLIGRYAVPDFRDYIWGGDIR